MTCDLLEFKCVCCEDDDRSSLMYFSKFLKFVYQNQKDLETHDKKQSLSQALHNTDVIKFYFDEQEYRKQSYELHNFDKLLKKKSAKVDDIIERSQVDTYFTRMETVY